MEVIKGYYLYIDKSFEKPYLLFAEEFDSKRIILCTSNKNELKIMIDLLGMRIEKYKIINRQYEKLHYAILKLMK